MMKKKTFKNDEGMFVKIIITASLSSLSVLI